MSSDRTISIPDGFVAVPLTDAPADGTLRMAVLIRREPDPVAGRLVALPAPTSGRAILGAMIDPDGRPTDWLRIEQQDLGPAGAAGATGADTGGAVDTNQGRDDRWSAAAHALAAVGGRAAVPCGWEARHPAPTVLDTETWRLRTAVDPASGDPLALCTDDARLESAARPAFSRSCARFLASGPGAEALHEVTPGAAADRAALVPPGCEPFDLECRLRRVAILDGVELDTALDVLAGREAGGLRHGRETVALGLPIQSPVDDAEQPIVGDGWLFHGSFGRRARVVESLHLRTRLWADVVEDAAELVRHLGRPLLDIRPERITVSVADDGPGLPRLWTLRAHLATAGSTAVMTLPGSGERRFVRAIDGGPSIYESGSASRGVSGRAAVRIREVLDDDGGTVVIGTVESTERLPDGRTDLVRLDLPLRDATTPLHVRIEAAGEAGGADADAAGPRRWRSIATEIAPDQREALAAAAGIPLDGVRFEAVPAVGTPSDLYALAVLGARMLLCDRATDLPVVMDDLLAFAGRLGRTHDPETPLDDRLDFLLRSDPQWLERLGPGRLRPDDPSAEQMIPAGVWRDVLSVLVRLLPGAGPDSWCRDAGDMAVAAPHRVFEPAREAVGRLVLRTRSLAVVDWRQNREVAGLLRRVRSGLAAPRPA